MRGRLPLVLGALLLVAVAAQTWLFLERTRAHRVVPVVLPYRLPDPGAPPPPEDLPASGPGPVMTTDDVVRGLLVLSDGSAAGVPALTEAQRRALFPLVREAAERKRRLLELRREEEGLQAALAARAVPILRSLSPRQLEVLLSNRDETERLLRRLPDLQPRPPAPGGSAARPSRRPRSAGPAPGDALPGSAAAPAGAAPAPGPRRP